jgi:hypothetical protein
MNLRISILVGLIAAFATGVAGAHGRGALRRPQRQDRGLSGQDGRSLAAVHVSE